MKNDDVKIGGNYLAKVTVLVKLTIASPSEG